MAEPLEPYHDWPSLELAIKAAARKSAAEAGPGVSAATVDAKIRQARFDRFLSRVFADGEASEWLLKGGMSVLARVPRSRTTRDVDLAALKAVHLDGAERAHTELVSVDPGDQITFRLIRSIPIGRGQNQPGVAMRRYVFTCMDADTDMHVETVDVVIGPAPDRRGGGRGTSQPALPAPTAHHSSLSALPDGRSDRRQGLRHDGNQLPRPTT